MFSEEELKHMRGLKRFSDHVEVTCGLTLRKFGDFMGKLKVFADGRFLIDCDCSPGCPRVNLTPYDFEKHSGRVGTRYWKRHIWVLIKDEKVALWKTALFKYYKHATNEGNGSSLVRGKQVFHRDEFIKCSRCKKERRFRLRTKEDCRIYHDALANKKWKCSLRPYDKINCGDEEERESRKSVRGCPRIATCKGCTTCVCFGCLKCRFVDCNCRTCEDFMQNAEP